MAQGGLHPTAIQRRAGAVRRAQATVAIGKEQLGMAVQLPELPQGRQRCLGQGHEAIPVALGIADLDTHPGRVHVADLERQPLTQPEPEAVDGEVEHPVTQGARGTEQPLRFLHRHDVGQALGFGWLDQIGHHPGLLQDVRGVELEPVEIEFDGAPGVGSDQVAEVLGQLRFGERVDLTGEVAPQTPDGAGVGVDGLGLQPLEFEVLQMQLVLLVEVR